MALTWAAKRGKEVALRMVSEDSWETPFKGYVIRIVVAMVNDLRITMRAKDLQGAFLMYVLTFSQLAASRKSSSRRRLIQEWTSSQDYYQSGSSQQHQSYSSRPSRQDAPYHQGTSSKPDKLSGFLDKIQDTVADFGVQVAEKIGTALDPGGNTQYGPDKPNTENRYGSFVPERRHNEVKWYVDGCSYMYAVSRALERAKEYIWILDCECYDSYGSLGQVRIVCLTYNSRVAFSRALS
jgi:hypothetical protein